MAKSNEWVIVSIFKTLFKLNTDITRIATERFFSWIGAQIDKVTKAIKIAQYEIEKQLIEWWKNDVGFWIMIGAAGLIAYTVPYVYAAIVAIAEIPAVKKFFSWVEQSVKKIFKSTDFITIEAMNNILKVIWPEYRLGWDKINESLSKLMERIDLPVNTLALLSNDVRAIATSTAALFGINTDTAELIAYDKVTDFFSTMDKRMNRYIRNPEKLYMDFVAWVEQPFLEEQDEGVRRINNNINKLATKTSNAIERIGALGSSVTNLANRVPGSWKREDFWDIRKKANQAVNGLYAFKNNTIDPLIATTKANEKRFAEREEKIKQMQMGMITPLKAPLTPIDEIQARKRLEGKIETYKIGLHLSDLTAKIRSINA